MNNLLEYNGYHAKIELDPEDGIFIGTVIGINDKLAFHGTSLDELKTVFGHTIDDYLEMCAQFGKEPEKEYKGSFNVRIPSELHKEADLRAKSEDIPLNQLVANAIDQYLHSPDKSETVIYCLPSEMLRRQCRSQINANSYREADALSFDFKYVKEGFVN